MPVYIRSDNGLEFTARRVWLRLDRLEVKPLHVEQGSPWENGNIGTFYGRMQDELQAREIFYSSKETQGIIEAWRQHGNTVRPYSSLGYRPPAPAATLFSLPFSNHMHEQREFTNVGAG